MGQAQKKQEWPSMNNVGNEPVSSIFSNSANFLDTDGPRSDAKAGNLTVNSGFSQKKTDSEAKMRSPKTIGHGIATGSQEVDTGSPPDNVLTN